MENELETIFGTLRIAKEELNPVYMNHDSRLHCRLLIASIDVMCDAECPY